MRWRDPCNEVMEVGLVGFCTLKISTGFSRETRVEHPTLIESHHMHGKLHYFFVVREKGLRENNALALRSVKFISLIFEKQK
jgi:hypothetical protein